MSTTGLKATHIRKFHDARY